MCIKNACLLTVCRAVGVIHLKVALPQLRVRRILMPATGKPLVRFDPLDPVLVPVRSKHKLEFQTGNRRGIRLFDELLRVDIYVELPQSGSGWTVVNSRKRGVRTAAIVKLLVDLPFLLRRALERVRSSGGSPYSKLPRPARSQCSFVEEGDPRYRLLIAANPARPNVGFTVWTLERRSMCESTPHRDAAETFTRRARDRYGDAIEAILLYGSVARGTERGVDSDVDLLVVVSDTVDASALDDRLRDLAYDIELDRGVVLSLLVLSASDVEAQTDRPFFATVQQDATRLHG